MSGNESRRRTDDARSCLIQALAALEWPPRYGDALLFAAMAAAHLGHLADVDETERRWTQVMTIIEADRAEGKARKAPKPPLPGTAIGE